MVVSHTTTAPARPVVTAVDRGPRRQCGRCRMVFVLHEDGHVPALADRWMCEPCRTRLLANGAR